MSAQQERSALPEDIANRWPRIRRFLRPDNSTGWVDDDHLSFTRGEERLTPTDRAAAYEEWADFYEWRLERQTHELAHDRIRRHLVAEWTESMTYSCRRSAAFIRGENPGAWVSLSTRRPDLTTEREAIVAEIVASLESTDPLAKTG